MSQDRQREKKRASVFRSALEWVRIQRQVTKDPAEASAAAEVEEMLQGRLDQMNFSLKGKKKAAAQG